jgi:hypothetical protein
MSLTLSTYRVGDSPFLSIVWGLTAESHLIKVLLFLIYVDYPSHGI